MKLEKIKPPVYLLFCLVLIAVLAFVFPQMRILGLPSVICGIMMVLSGIGLNIWAWLFFKRAGTPEDYAEPTALVKDGPYRFSRNPMHVGGILLVLGVSLMTGNVVTLIAPVILYVIMRVVFVPFEERMMEDIFGNEFLDYKKDVRRWI